MFSFKVLKALAYRVWNNHNHIGNARYNFNDRDEYWLNPNHYKFKTPHYRQSCGVNLYNCIKGIKLNRNRKGD